MLAHYIYFYLPRVFAQSATNTSDGPVAALSIYLYGCFNPPFDFSYLQGAETEPQKMRHSSSRGEGRAGRVGSPDAFHSSSSASVRPRGRVQKNVVQ